MPEISVLMPVYNTPVSYLKEALDSVLAQTYSDFELVIINDGSTNEDVEKCIKRYSDQRIKYFYKPNSGVADSLNYGLQKCKGAFVARMDSDDICLPDRFEKQVAFLKQHPEISIVGSWIEFFPKKSVWKTMPSPKLLDFLGGGNQLAHPSVMFRLASFKQHHLKYDPSYMAEDYELWVRAAQNLKIANIQEVLLKYRASEGQVTFLKADKMRENSERICLNLVKSLCSDSLLRQHLLEFSKKSQTKISLFGMPLIKISQKPQIRQIYRLFSLIPFWSRQQKPNECLLSLHKPNLDDTALLGVLQEMKSFSYMPNSGNMGDAFIAAATMNWLDQNKLHWHRTQPKEFPENFVYGGGGVWVPEWVNQIDQVLEKMSKAKKVVILPSSFNNVPTLVRLLDERFTVFCREKRSYDYLLAQGTKAKILLDHDMAFRLAKCVSRPVFLGKKLKKKGKILEQKIKSLPKHCVRFFREDVESKFHFETDLDLSVALGYFSAFEKRENLDYAASFMLKAVSEFDEIKTDRLHVAIAAALMGVNTQMYDNTYSKLKAVYDQTLNQFSYVNFQEGETLK